MRLTDLSFGFASYVGDALAHPCGWPLRSPQRSLDRSLACPLAIMRKPPTLITRNNNKPTRGGSSTWIILIIPEEGRQPRTEDCKSHTTRKWSKVRFEPVGVNSRAAVFGTLNYDQPQDEVTEAIAEPALGRAVLTPLAWRSRTDCESATSPIVNPQARTD
jgi:hypothetical protein